MKLVYLSGGVGGARLARGLCRVLQPDELTLIVNTGDDLTHWGLSICPDLDTMLYTLAEVGDVARGWGLAGETFAALSWVERYGGEAWFQLGDRDLATHLMRTQWLREGQSLTQVTQRLSSSLGVRARILPMSDEACETMIEVDGGTLPFQRWLVERRAEPLVRRVWSRGEARPSAAVIDALRESDWILIGPSNPYVSIDPILNLPGVRQLVAARPVVSVSPIVHGRAIKGPLVGMLASLAGSAPEPASIAAHYGPMLTGLVVERGDETSLYLPRLAQLATDTVMNSLADSCALAQRILAFAATLRST
jgi:LPPG:FO 2-phospho-L-lactate transferase